MTDLGCGSTELGPWQYYTNLPQGEQDVSSLSFGNKKGCVGNQKSFKEITKILGKSPCRKECLDIPFKIVGDRCPDVFIGKALHVSVEVAVTTKKEFCHCYSFWECSSYFMRRREGVWWYFWPTADLSPESLRSWVGAAGLVQWCRWPTSWLIAWSCCLDPRLRQEYATVATAKQRLSE